MFLGCGTGGLSESRDHVQWACFVYTRPRIPFQTTQDVEQHLKTLALFVLLLLVVPMALLNPMGRDAFAGYYAGVIATWAAYVVALRGASAAPGRHS